MNKTPWHLKVALKENTIPIIKSTNPALRQVTYVAMQPGVDLHGDYVDAEEIRKAKESFNKSKKQANFFHLSNTDSFEVIESYQTFTDIELDGIFVEKGSWLVTLQTNETLWEMILSGEINGVSIGARATVEELEEEDND